MSGFQQSSRPGAVRTMHVRACRRCGNGRLVELVELARRPDGPALTIPQIAYLLALSQMTVRTMVDRGEIQGSRHGVRKHKQRRDSVGRYRIPWRPFRAYLHRIGMLPLREGERL